MPLPPHVFAPAFHHRRLGWFFALLVGTMVYLASFATAAEATLSMMTFAWDKDMESRLTVEIPAVDDEASTPQADRIAQVLAVLRAMPGIESARQLPDDETARLIKPWIGRPELLKELPVPTLIDVKRANDKPAAAEIHDRIKTIVGDAHVEDHAEWLISMSRLVQGLAAIAGLVIFLTGLTLAVAVSLLCRTIMATEHELIALLHVMGADDGDIARHFQFHAQRMAVPAAFIGFALALLSAGPLLFFLRRFTDLATPHLGHWLGLGGVVLLVPITAIAIAATAARLSALRLLHGMP